ncbi:MAG: HD domain-containing protein [Candidatus Brocadiales bacterium]|nr:HD domain-containing protein [Candidatus Brocadiales bacterium]
MTLGNEIIKLLQDNGHEAYYAKETARSINGKLPDHPKHVNIATSASLSKIRDLCRKEGLPCRIHNKINKMTLELIVKNKYIIAPFIKTTIKNNYAVRKYSDNKDDYMNSQGFTINATLYDPIAKKAYYAKDAKSDLSDKNKVIRLVGDPHGKITENRMYLLEAGKILADLGGKWQVDFATFEAIQQRALEIAIVSAEAVRWAFTDLMKHSDTPSLAFRFYKNTGMLTEILPELMRGVNLAQSNKANNLDLFNHIMYALDSVTKDKHNAEPLRWACIFHDIAKPYTKSFDKKGNVHFYGHDKIGAIFATRWLEAHKFDRSLINKVATICRHHLFDASLRLDDKAINKLIGRVGKEHILDLIDMREADRYGTGRPDISMKKVEILREKVKKLLK